MLYIEVRINDNKTLTDMADLKKYTDQIQDLALFAKAQNFDFDNGDFDNLIKDWIMNRKALTDELNQEAIKSTLKFMVG